MRRTLLLAILLAPAAALAQIHQQPIPGPMTTAAAAADQMNLCPTGAGYPAAWAWPAGETKGGMVAATSGTPKIEQYRGTPPVLIATYSHWTNQPGCTLKQDGTDWQNPAAPAASGCGPFTRTHSWRLFAPGDDFKVYPAVYGAGGDMPWIGPVFTGDQPWPDDMVAPDYVTIEGVEQGGKWPVILSTTGNAPDNNLDMGVVYLDKSTGLTIKGLVIASTGPQVQGLKAAIYNVAASNLTTEQLHVTGFEAPSSSTNGANGIFGGGAYTGWWHITNVEVDHNGGATGSQQHNIYIPASQTDPNYVVRVLHLYSHDAVQGHLLKTRAQNLTLLASYLDGGVPQPGEAQADDYDVDMSNGGNLIALGNVFVKNASGYDTNGINLAWMMEGNPDARPLSLDIENNTFVTLAKTFDGSHSNFPMSFLYPQQVPGAPAFPKLTKVAKIRDNAFVGYCPTGQAPLDFRGDFPVMAGFSELNPDFTFTDTFVPGDGYAKDVGTTTYAHVSRGGGPRKLPTIGAFD